MGWELKFIFRKFIPKNDGQLMFICPVEFPKSLRLIWDWYMDWLSLRREGGWDWKSRVLWWLGRELFGFCSVIRRYDEMSNWTYRPFIRENRDFLFSVYWIGSWLKKFFKKGGCKVGWEKMYRGVLGDFWLEMMWIIEYLFLWRWKFCFLIKLFFV